MAQQLLALLLEANNLVTVILYSVIGFLSLSAGLSLYNRENKEYYDTVKDDELQATAVFRIGMALIFSYVAAMRSFPDFAVLSDPARVIPLQIATVGLGSILSLVGIILSRKVSKLREQIAYEEKLAEEKKVLEAQKKATEYLRKTMMG